MTLLRLITLVGALSIYSISFGGAVPEVDACLAGGSDEEALLQVKSVADSALASVVNVTILADAGNALLDPAARGVSISGSQKFTWAEGPVWLPREETWIWSDVFENTQWMYSDGELSRFRRPGFYANGNTLDREGRLLTCQHQKGVVLREDLQEGTLDVVLVDTYNDQKLTSPNDVIVSKTGIIYFSDPDYGTNRLEGNTTKLQESNRVYRFDPASENITAVVEDMLRPNGLCLSPDETKLYVAESGAVEPINHVYDPDGPKGVRAYDLSADGTLTSNGEWFVRTTTEEGVVDGIKSDEHGNVWISSWKGVFVYSPSGERLAHIKTPGKVANMAFGGRDGKTLLITAEDTAWALETKVRGATSTDRAWIQF